MGMRHVYENHMQPTVWVGKSVFKSTVRSEVKDMVDATINYPDEAHDHSTNESRKFYIRNFGNTIEYDKFINDECTRVQIVYNFVEEIVITASPIL